MVGSSYEDIRLTDSFFYKSTIEDARNGSGKIERGKMINEADFKEKVIE